MARSRYHDRLRPAVNRYRATNISIQQSAPTTRSRSTTRLRTHYGAHRLNVRRRPFHCPVPVVSPCVRRRLSRLWTETSGRFVSLARLSRFPRVSPFLLFLKRPAVFHQRIALSSSHTTSYGRKAAAATRFQQVRNKFVCACARVVGTFASLDDRSSTFPPLPDCYYRFWNRLIRRTRPLFTCCRCSLQVPVRSTQCGFGCFVWLFRRPPPTPFYAMASPCVYYLRGACRFGDRCWNSHDYVRSDSPYLGEYCATACTEARILYITIFSSHFRTRFFAFQITVFTDDCPRRSLFSLSDYCFETDFTRATYCEISSLIFVNDPYRISSERSYHFIYKL